MNNIALTVALATAPSTAFAELRERPRFWFPLLLVTLATAGVVYWYYSIVDIEWLKDAMFSSDPKFQELNEEQRAAAMSMFSRTALVWSSVASMLVVMPVFFVLEALYLLLAAKVTKLPQEFRHWFAMASWCSLPFLLGAVVSVILLLMSETTQISAGVLQPLSLNELLLHRPVGSPGEVLFQSLSIPFFLSCALMIIGIRVWSQRSWVFSATVTVLPWVVVYGLWAFFAFR